MTVPVPRVGHQAARPEHPAEATHLRHQVGGGDRHVEVEEALGLDARDEIVGADDVGAGSRRLGGLLAGGEHGDAHRLAEAVRQRERASDDLVGAAGVDAEAHVANSTVSSKCAVARLFTRSTASTSEYS